MSSTFKKLSGLRLNTSVVLVTTHHSDSAWVKLSGLRLNSSVVLLTTHHILLVLV